MKVDRLFKLLKCEELLSLFYFILSFGTNNSGFMLSPGGSVGSSKHTPDFKARSAAKWIKLWLDTAHVTFPSFNLFIWITGRVRIGLSHLWTWKQQPSLHLFSEPLPTFILTSDQVRQVPLFRGNTDIPKEREEVGKKNREKNPIWEINSQHPTEPVLGSLAHSVLSYPLVSCSKAKHVFDTRLEGIWRRYRFLLCFTLHRESVCVCQGWDFFSLPPPPSLPPSFFFSLAPCLHLLLPFPHPKH